MPPRRHTMQHSHTSREATPSPATQYQPPWLCPKLSSLHSMRFRLKRTRLWLIQRLYGLWRYRFSRHAAPRRATPRHAAPRRATPCHAMSRRVTPRHAASRHAMPRHATPCRAAPLRNRPMLKTTLRRSAMPVSTLPHTTPLDRSVSLQTHPPARSNQANNKLMISATSALETNKQIMHRAASSDNPLSDVTEQTVDIQALYQLV